MDIELFLDSWVLSTDDLILQRKRGVIRFDWASHWFPFLFPPPFCPQPGPGAQYIAVTLNVCRKLEKHEPPYMRFLIWPTKSSATFLPRQE